jgi:hypothetical protein
MKQPAHTITLAPWHGLSFGERLMLETTTILLWPLPPDDRVTVLINLLAAQIESMVENEDQVDAIIDVLRMQMKKMIRDAPPLQPNRLNASHDS